MRILISGPYGGYNLGDDAIAFMIANEFEKRGAEVAITSNDPYKAKRYFQGKPHCIQQLDIRSGRLSMLREIRNFDAVVIGGGQQITESRLPNPIWGHLATAAQLCSLASHFKKKSAVLAVGVDSSFSRIGEFLIRNAFRNLDYLSVRDQESKERIEKICGKKCKVHLGADPVFLMEIDSVASARTGLRSKLNIDDNMPVVLIMPSYDRIHNLVYVDQLNSVVEELTREGLYVLYACSDLQESYDELLFRKGMLVTSKSAQWIHLKKSGIAGFKELIAGVDCLISSRMHPIILALIHRIPFICLSRANKMESLMSRLGISDYYSLFSFQKSLLLESIMSILVLRPERFYENIYENIQKIKESAEKQFDNLWESFFLNS